MRQLPDVSSRPCDRSRRRELDLDHLDLIVSRAMTMMHGRAWFAFIPRSYSTGVIVGGPAVRMPTTSSRRCSRRSPAA